METKFNKLNEENLIKLKNLSDNPKVEIYHTNNIMNKYIEINYSESSIKNICNLIKMNKNISTGCEKEIINILYKNWIKNTKKEIENIFKIEPEINLKDNNIFFIHEKKNKIMKLILSSFIFNRHTKLIENNFIFKNEIQISINNEIFADFTEKINTENEDVIINEYHIVLCNFLKLSSKQNILKILNKEKIKYHTFNEKIDTYIKIKFHDFEELKSFIWNNKTKDLLYNHFLEATKFEKK